jgi:hypothetical protein
VIYTLIGQFVCALVLAIVAWIATEHVLKSLGLVATVVSYGCHRTWLRFLLLAGWKAPKGCIACGHDHRHVETPLAPMPPAMPMENGDQ